MRNEDFNQYLNNLMNTKIFIILNKNNLYVHKNRHFS